MFSKYSILDDPIPAMVMIKLLCHKIYAPKLNFYFLDPKSNDNSAKKLVSFIGESERGIFQEFHGEYYCTLQKCQ